MSEVDVNKWTPEALALEVVRDTGRPVREDTFEADGVAAFHRKYWQPTADRPGMQVTEAQVPLSTADEIESLVRAIRTLHNDELFPTLDPSKTSKLEARGRWLASKIASACELVLDDGVLEPADEALAAAKARVEDDTRSTRIEYMLGLHAVAAEVKPRLLQIKNFEQAWIDELLDCARKLSQEGPPQPGRPADPKIDLRNRMLTLLDDRVSKVRRAARYVFDEHPEIVRLVTSAYERKKRLEAKRRKKQQDASGDAN